MDVRLALPGLVLVSAVGSAAPAAAEPTQPEACFGAFSSTFAQENPRSGQAVSTLATSGPGVIGTFAAEKPICP